MILLFTDFGWAGPYVGQMKAVLARAAPDVPAVDLMHDAPAHDPKAAAYLLAALAPETTPGDVVLGVVDPGVGGPRPAIVAKAGGRWFVGPDNGLFDIVARRGGDVPMAWEIMWRPERLSASFHGRDLFAPIAARIAMGDVPDPRPGATPWAESRRRWSVAGRDWPEDLAEAIYVDAFGNVMTGMRAANVSASCQIKTPGGAVLAHADTFSAVPPGQGFWYGNAGGLVEIAINRGRADAVFGLKIGDPVRIVNP